ncbi:BnaC01g36420D [Brassica napus]|uniref:BnaC01g36420D protein n=1 Tax=Brassica napus TaxID=3708 RepID=A0A078H683_BRANA|nr:BnaC01g36420D [Brassica napus]
MNKNTRIDIPSSSSPSLASADGELHEDDIFAIDITHAPRPSPTQQQHPPARHLQRSKSSLKNVEASGILAALPEPSGGNISSTASSSSSSGGGASARTIPAAPKPPQERLPFTSSFMNGGKFPQSAPVRVPSAMMNRHKKEFKLTDVVDVDDDEEGEMLPPHEMVARSLAQSSLLSCSVLEGAGRTLKGRDLRQVRNAVFRRTGFID